MVIEKMIVSKYKGVQNYVLEPKKVNAITGNIGCGKSSIMEAVRFSVTGIADTPQEEADVKINILGGKEINWRIRKGTKSVRMDNRATSQESVKKMLETGAGVNMECMKVLTSGKLLANMNSGSLGDFLIKSGLLPMSMDFETMVSLCGIDPILAKALGEYLPKTRPFTLEDIQAAYREVYDARTALNREIATAETYARFEGEKPARTVASVEYDLAEIIGNEEKQKAYRILEENYQKAVQGQRKIQAEIADIEAQIKAMRVSEPDAAEKMRLQTRLEDLQDEISEVTQTIARLTNSIAVQKKALENINSPVCPLSERLKCNTDKTEILSDIEISLDDLDMELQRAEHRKEKLFSEREEITEKLTSLNDQAAAYAKLQSLYNTRKALMDSVPEIPAMPDAPVVMENQAEKKASLQMEKKRIEDYTRSITEKRKVADLNRKLDILEQMLAVLAPKSGLREKIIANVLAPLEKHCNDLAEKLRLDFKLSIRVNNGVSILCRPKATMDFVNLSDVSSGEQLLASFLILDMLNTLSGFGILMMDNLDALDSHALDELITVLTSPDVLCRYDHIFVSMVAHDDSVAVLDKHSSAIDQYIRL